MKWLKTLPDSWWFKVHGSPMQTAGIPDIVGCLQGRFVGIEMKVKGNKPSKMQNFIIKKIREAGGSVVVAYSKKEVQEFIKELQDGTT